jgi:hypothetical protein
MFVTKAVTHHHQACTGQRQGFAKLLVIPIEQRKLFDYGCLLAAHDENALANIALNPVH